MNMNCALRSSLSPNRRFLSLSFSGGGHLLPYHLGVSSTLLRILPPNQVRAVSGSSAGAICAALYTILPDKISEYADRFIHDKGRGLHHLDLLLSDSKEVRCFPNLYIATTRCRDGLLHLFSFQENEAHSKSEIVRCVKASCTIPPSFHPFDIFPKHEVTSYPNMEGIKIGNEYYVDGGIAAAAPPTPIDTFENICRVVVSPISGGIVSNEKRISPTDKSWKMLPMEIIFRGGFKVRPSIGNLKALKVSTGTSSREKLRDWWKRGVDDAERFVVEDFGITPR